MAAPVQLNNDLMADQLLQYRAIQQQKFQAEQLRQEQVQEQAAVASQSCGYAAEEPCEVVRETIPRMRAARPFALTLRADGIASVQASDSCPGTPREYRERQQDRFAAEQLRRRLELDIETDATLTESPAAEDAEILSAPASPPTPRLRGSASLRAISAARAMRAAEAAPLPGAAWPGHAQKVKPSRPKSAGRGRLPPQLPTAPHLATPSKMNSSSFLLTGSRSSSFGLPPRAPIQRSFSSCALEVANAHEGALSLGPLCC